MEETALANKTKDVKELLARAQTVLRAEDITNAMLPTIQRATLLAYPDAMIVADHLEKIDGRPIADRILVLPLPKDDKYGSLILPQTSQDDQLAGIVVAVGRGRWENGVRIPPEVGAGNYVAFSKYAARKVDIGGVEILQIHEGDITFIAGKRPE